MAKQPAPPPAEAAAEAPAAATPKSKKKLVIIIVAAVVLVGGAGAGWMLMGKKDGEAHAKSEDKKVAKAEGPPVFLPLESFVVNLQPPTSNQFFQADITLRVADAHTVDALKALMPEVRDRVLRLLAARTASELVAPGGREKLAEAVRVEVTRLVDPSAVETEKEPAAEKTAADGEAPEEPSADVEATEGESADAAADAEAAIAERKVRAVLFTSFIIQ
jgi:flagellar FliL protein